MVYQHGATDRCVRKSERSERRGEEGRGVTSERRKKIEVVDRGKEKEKEKGEKREGFWLSMRRNGHGAEACVQVCSRTSRSYGVDDKEREG